MTKWVTKVRQWSDLGLIKKLRDYIDLNVAILYYDLIRHFFVIGCAIVISCWSTWRMLRPIQRPRAPPTWSKNFGFKLWSPWAIAISSLGTWQLIDNIALLVLFLSLCKALRYLGLFLQNWSTLVAHTYIWQKAENGWSYDSGCRYLWACFLWENWSVRFYLNILLKVKITPSVILYLRWLCPSSLC